MAELQIFTVRRAWAVGPVRDNAMQYIDTAQTGGGGDSSLCHALQQVICFIANSELWMTVLVLLWRILIWQTKLETYESGAPFVAANIEDENRDERPAAQWCKVHIKTFWCKQWLKIAQSTISISKYKLIHRCTLLMTRHASSDPAATDNYMYSQLWKYPDHWLKQK